ncbi:MAG: Na/Pi cotransporter family protein [Clostridia bacterium]|nr:Na/Pi cotransporter family protein [Clostridia bacterium]
MQYMDYVYAVFALLAGIGVFLVGCNMLSDNVKALANSKIRSLLNKTSSNRVVGCGIGAVVTAGVQSSSLTTVMVVGLVNSGLMTLHQATSVIMGANIGTTITAQIAALQSFDFAAIAMGFAGIGVFVTIFSKKEKVKNIGNLIAGIGLVFLGLDVMSDSMKIFRESQALLNVLASVNNPLLLVVIGALITALIQSSSAMTTIVISMAGAGITIGGGGNAVLFVILGSNIGTCITALLSSLGTNVNAKRAAVIHLMFNMFGSVIFCILLLCWKNFYVDVLENLFHNPTTEIAMFHTFFNVTCTLLFLPFTKVFVKVSELLVKDGNKKVAKIYLDSRLISTPFAAINAVNKEVSYLLDYSTKTLKISVEGFIAKDESITEKIKENLIKINDISKSVTDYLVKISAHIKTVKEEEEINALYSNLSDIARVGELAENITKYTHKQVEENLIFSDKVKEQLMVMIGKIEEMSDLAKKAVFDGDATLLKEVEAKEDEVDNLRRSLIKDHLARLNAGECRAESSSVFINLVCNLERAGDHIDYVAHSIGRPA